MKKFIRLLFLGLALLAAAVEVKSRQQAAEENAQPEESQLKDRVKAFYQNLLKNDRVAALELVAPESKNQFLNTRYANGLVDFRVVGIEVDQSGERAKARVVRVTRVAKVRQPFDLEIIDTWQRSNGQWYFVLPPPGEVDTPFGKMKLGTDASKHDSAEAEAMRQKIEEHYKNVDPDQYIRALQKVAGSSTEQPKSGAKPPQAAAPDSKTDSQQTKPSTPPPPQGEASQPH
jgi:hypothetical protein